MDLKNEEEAKELPKINHERAVEIAGNILCNLLNLFDELDRVSIVKYGLNECSPFYYDFPSKQALKSVYLRDHRNWQLYLKEEDKAKAEYKTCYDDIDELFKQFTKH